MNDINTLAASLNRLTKYPSIADLHMLAAQLKQYSEVDVTNKLLPALTSSLLVTDIKRLMTGLFPGTVAAPPVVAQTAPSDANYPTPDASVDPGFAKGEPPHIKP